MKPITENEEFKAIRANVTFQHPSIGENELFNRGAEAAQSILQKEHEQEMKRLELTHEAKNLHNSQEWKEFGSWLDNNNKLILSHDGAEIPILFRE